MSRTYKIFDLLGRFNWLGHRLAEFQCRSCSSSFGASLPHDYQFSVQLVTGEVTCLVALVRDFLAHQPGLEDPDRNEHLLETQRCQCFAQLKERLEQVLRELDNLFEAYPRAYGLGKQDVRRSSPRRIPSASDASSWDCSEDEREEEAERREIAEQRKRAREYFEENYHSSGEHILFITNVLRRCVKQHRFLASHVLCKRPTCDRCCGGHVAQ